MALLAGLGLLVSPVDAFGTDLLAVVVGGYYLGGLADTRRDGLAGGLIYAGVGLFLGTFVAIPLGAALVGRASLDVLAVGTMIGFLFGLLYAVIFGIVGAVAGYAGARFKRRAS